MNQSVAGKAGAADFKTRKFGDVTCILGDCIQVVPTLDAKIADMVFADIPYATPHRKTTECLWDFPIDLKSFWAMVSNAAKDNAATVMTGVHPFTSLVVLSNVSQFKYSLTWLKKHPSGFMAAKRMPLRAHEDIVVFYARQCTYNPQMVKRDKPRVFVERARNRSFSAGTRSPIAGYTKIYTHRHPTSAIEFTMASDKSRGLHSTQKPVALLEWLIATYTNPGDLVFDPTAGSGTTGCAAINLGRRAILIEKDPIYFEVMCRRIAEHQQKIKTT